jgi:hypothetical protein
MLTITFIKLHHPKGAHISEVDSFTHETDMRPVNLKNISGSFNKCLSKPLSYGNRRFKPS